MTMVYLGLFSTIFEWIWNKILSPIVQFVASLLGSLFGWIFNNILVPILTLVLKAVLPCFLELLKDIFSGILYRILSWIFKAIDYMKIAFDIFIGTSKVSYQGKEQSLLNAMMSTKTVSTAFWIITALGIGIAMLLCIYAVMKSSLDFDFENKRPVGAVMRSMLKCFFQFLTIPFFIIFILQLSGIILSAVETALTDPAAAPKQTLGCILFAITSLDAAKGTTSANLSSNTFFGDHLSDGVRGMFYNGNISYMDIDAVKNYFELSKFDYLVGITMSIFLAVILLICCITFIRRIFELLMLYLVSPLFVATMPLDDGEKFKKWREMFIAKVFAGYGSVFSMKLYLMFCPIIIGNSIQWGSDATSKDATYFIKLIFLVGGAWAMLKTGSMITSILNTQSAQAEQATADYIGGRAGQMTAQAAGAVASGAGSVIGTCGQKFTSQMKQTINHFRQENKKKSPNKSSNTPTSYAQPTTARQPKNRAQLTDAGQSKGPAQPTTAAQSKNDIT